MSVKNIVAKDQGTGVIAYKFFAYDEGLRQAIRTGLNRVLNVHPPLAAVSQQLRKSGCILRGADEQNIFDTGQHERGQRVVDHGLVVDRHQLLGDRLRHGVQAGTTPTRQNNASACIHSAILP